MKRRTIYGLSFCLLLIVLSACGFPKFRRFVQESPWISDGYKISISLQQEFDDHGRPVKSELYGLYLLCELDISSSLKEVDSTLAITLLRELLRVDTFLVSSNYDSNELRLPIGTRLDLTDHYITKVRLYSGYFQISDSVDTVHIRILYNRSSKLGFDMPLAFTLIRNEKREFYVY